MLFLEYPPCSTCKKAKQYLLDRGIGFECRHIKEQNPGYEELRDWVARSGLPLRRFFNTSGMLYQSLHLKDRLPEMSEEEQLRLLATDGMLVRRPILVRDDLVLVGFRPNEWDEKL